MPPTDCQVLEVELVLAVEPVARVGRGVAAGLAGGDRLHRRRGGRGARLALELPDARADLVRGLAAQARALGARRTGRAGGRPAPRGRSGRPAGWRSAPRASARARSGDPPAARAGRWSWATADRRPRRRRARRPARRAACPPAQALSSSWFSSSRPRRPARRCTAGRVGFKFQSDDVHPRAHSARRANVCAAHGPCGGPQPSRPIRVATGCGRNRFPALRSPRERHGRARRSRPRCEAVDSDGDVIASVTYPQPLAWVFIVLSEPRAAAGAGRLAPSAPLACATGEGTAREPRRPAPARLPPRLRLVRRLGARRPDGQHRAGVRGARARRVARPRSGSCWPAARSRSWARC